MEQQELRGWYDRGYLPHFDTDEYPQMITYRMADALPRKVLERLMSETEKGDSERYARFEKMLDAGHGSCVLRRKIFAEIVVDNLEFHDGSRYRLQDWVVMPNHAHVGYDKPRCTISKIVKGWKSYTATRIKALLGTRGDGNPFWQAGFHDRFARDRQHFFNMQCYIFLNPVKAGLVDDPFDWPYSSIHRHTDIRDSIERWWERWKDDFWGFENKWRS